MLEINIKGKKEADIVFSLIGIALCSLLKNHQIDTDFSEKILFNPYVLSILEKTDDNRKLIDAIHKGTELDDIQRIVPHSLESTLKEMNTEFLSVIETHIKELISNEKWLYDIS